MAQDFISGMLAGQQYVEGKQKIELNKFLLAEAPVKLEEEKLALKIATTDYSKREAMAKMLAQNHDKIPTGQNPLDNAANALYEMGSAAAQSGLPEEAIKDFKEASAIKAQQSRAAYQQWEETLQKTKFGDQMLATAHDEASWQHMNHLVEMITGQKSVLADKPYSPELVAALKESSQTKRTAAQEALTKAQTAEQRTLEQVNQARIPLVKAQAEAAQIRADALKKAGGIGAMPSTKVVSAVADAIKASDPDMDAAVARTLARDIAPRVQELVEDEGKTQQQAVHAAVREAKRNGTIPSVKPGRVTPGSLPTKPLPLPANPTDPEAYVDGQWYTMPDGEPGYYDEETQKLYHEGEGPDFEEAN